MADRSRNRRVMIASIAAHTRWAGIPDRTAATAAMRKAAEDRFEKQVDPEGTLDPATRAKLAASARKAHFLRMALRSAEVRRANAVRKLDSGQANA